MSVRLLGPLRIDEFTAGFLEDILNDELESLEEQLHEQRDKADRLCWARLKLRIHGLRSLRFNIQHLREQLGPPSAEDLEHYAGDVERWSQSMPRSKANEAIWKAQKAEERERRKQFEMVRSLAK